MGDVRVARRTQPTSPQLAHVVGTGASARAPSSPPCRRLCPHFDIVIHGEIIARDTRQLRRLS